MLGTTNAPSDVAVEQQPAEQPAEQHIPGLVEDVIAASHEAPVVLDGLEHVVEDPAAYLGAVAAGSGVEGTRSWFRDCLRLSGRWGRGGV